MIHNRIVGRLRKLFRLQFAYDFPGPVVFS